MAFVMHSKFDYHDFLSLKAHLSLDEFLLDVSNKEAASRVYYYLEVCWLAAGVNFKKNPLTLSVGRNLLAMKIKNNPRYPCMSEIRNSLYLAITSADGVASRVGDVEIRRAQIFLSRQIDAALVGNNS